MKKRILLIVAALVGHLFAFKPLVRADEIKAPASPASDTKAPDKAKEPASTAPPEFLSTYKLVPQDKVKFNIDEDPGRDAEFPELIVSSLGQLSFPISRVRQSPLISIQAAGKTLEQIRIELVALLEVDYYYKATVDLQLTSKSERFGQVTFVGPIIKGQLKLLPLEQKKVSDAIVEKGYTDYANLRRVKLMRDVPGSKTPKEFIIDVNAILHKGRKDLDMILEDGDTINVPEKGFNLF